MCTFFVVALIKWHCSDGRIQWLRSTRQTTILNNSRNIDKVLHRILWIITSHVVSQGYCKISVERILLPKFGRVLFSAASLSHHWVTEWPYLMWLKSHLPPRMTDLSAANIYVRVAFLTNLLASVARDLRMTYQLHSRHSTCLSVFASGHSVERQRNCTAASNRKAASGSRCRR